MGREHSDRDRGRIGVLAYVQYSRGDRLETVGPFAVVVPKNATLNAAQEEIRQQLIEASRSYDDSVRRIIDSVINNPDTELQFHLARPRSDGRVEVVERNVGHRSPNELARSAERLGAIEDAMPVVVVEAQSSAGGD